MRAERITETAEAVLLALATYRYLTPAQMLRLGVTSSPSHLYDTLRTLSGQAPRKLNNPDATAAERPNTRRPNALVLALDFGALPGHGRLERIFALTPRGAALLAEHDEAAEAPKQASMFRSDYFHRIACVDFHIALRQWAERAGATVDFFHAYYDPVAGSPRDGRFAPKTRIALTQGALVPDAVFAFSDEKGVRRLCTFEMYNRRRTARVIRQLSTYLRALDERAVEKAYAYPHSVRVLLGFEDAQGMRLVCERARAHPGFSREGGYAKWFFLAPLPAIRERFLSFWQRFDGEPVALF